MQQIRMLANDNAYLGIKERVISDELAPNQVLTEDFLTNLLKTSRTPLREGIQIKIPLIKTIKVFLRNKKKIYYSKY